MGERKREMNTTKAGVKANEDRGERVHGLDSCRVGVSGVFEKPEIEAGTQASRGE